MSCLVSRLADALDPALTSPSAAGGALPSAVRITPPPTQAASSPVAAGVQSTKPSGALVDLLSDDLPPPSVKPPPPPPVPVPAHKRPSAPAPEHGIPIPPMLALYAHSNSVGFVCAS